MPGLFVFLPPLPRPTSGRVNQRVRCERALGHTARILGRRSWFLGGSVAFDVRHFRISCLLLCDVRFDALLPSDMQADRYEYEVKVF